MSAPRTFRAAALQMASESDVDHNLAVAFELIRKAADLGAKYAQLPEHFNYLGPAHRYKEIVEETNGPTVEKLAKLARTLGIAVHIGSMVTPAMEPGKFANTSVLIGESGDVLATYSKVHMFDVVIPGVLDKRESAIMSPGRKLVVADLPGFRLGLSICFDLRFPELYRSLATAGATVLAIPSAFTAVTGAAHWETLVRARAIENHAYVVAANQVGRTPDGIESFGHSMIVEPWGSVLAEATGGTEEVVVADLDLNEPATRRSEIPVLQVRTPDIYAAPVVVSSHDEA